MLFRTIQVEIKVKSNHSDVPADEPRIFNIAENV
jgi:hypothetical protein